MDETDAWADMFRTPAATALPIDVPSPVTRSTPKATPRPLLWIAASLVALAGWVLAAAALLQAAVGRGWDTALGPVAIESVANLAIFGGIALIAVLALRVVAPPLTAPRAPMTLWVPVALVFGLAGLSYCVGMASLAGVLTRPAPAAPPTTLAVLLLGTVVILCQSAAEELFFRGWLQRALLGVVAPTGAIAATAAAFALLHILGGARAPLAIVNLFLGGCVFGLIAWRSGSIVPAIAAHFGWNWAEQLLWGVDPNPGTGAFGALFDHDIVGSVRLGGSAEGLNASVTIALVLLAFLVPLAGWPRRAAPQPA